MLLLLFSNGTPPIASYQPGFQPGFQAIGPWPPTGGGRLARRHRTFIGPDPEWQRAPGLEPIGQDFEAEDAWLMGLMSDDDYARSVQ